MILKYVVFIWREGNFIRGSAEKIYENSKTGERHYDGIHRTRCSIEGSIEKNYLTKDRIYLHVVEDGHGRESTNFYDLTIFSNCNISGTFQSMVANQSGKATLTRSAT